MKKCTKCKAEKPKSEFAEHKQTADRRRPDCRECVKEYNRLYNEKHRQSLLAKRAAYKDQNKDLISTSGASYYARNRERIILKSSEYKKANPAYVLQLQRNRRAKKKNSSGTHTAADVDKLVSLQRGKCAGCPRKLKTKGKEKYHVDHMVSLARGGSNDKYNLQILCPSCNLGKHAKDPIEWAQKNGRLL